MAKKFKVKTDCGAIVEYDTAGELGYIVGFNGLKMHNQYEPIHKESEEYNEGRFDGKTAREKQKMTKRESGWYRVWSAENENQKIRRYYAYDFTWIESNSRDGSMMEVGDSFYWKIDTQMVMTPSGEMVYHNQYDPLYSTKQEG